MSTIEIEKLSCKQETTLDFLGLIYGEDELPGSIPVGRFDGGYTTFTWCKSLKQAAQSISVQNTHNDVYYGPGLQGGHQPYAKKGGADNVVALPGFSGDFDYGDKGNGKKYPPTKQECADFLNSLKYPPTIIVHSGGGLHAYWLFNELWNLASKEEREKAKRTSEGWFRHIQKAAKKSGWIFDSTYNLDRVLRPVGTLNRKGDTERPVELESYDENGRFNPDDFAEFELPETTNTSGVPSSNGQLTVPNRDLDDSELGPIFEVMMTESVKFRQSWERNRPDFTEQSASVYTGSLGMLLLYSGAEDIEIVNICETWRHRHAEKHHDANWYKSELKRLKKKAVKNSDSQSAASIDDEQQVEYLKEKLRLPGLTAIRKIGAEKGLYQAVLDDDKKIDLGTARQILVINNVRAAILDSTGVNIVERKKEWPRIVASITSAGNANVVQISGDDEETLAWIESYAGHLKWGYGTALNNPDEEQIFDLLRLMNNEQDSAGYFQSDGSLFIHPGSLLLHITIMTRRFIESKELSARMVRLGFTYVQKKQRWDGKRAQRRLWKSPKGFSLEGETD